MSLKMKRRLKRNGSASNHLTSFSWKVDFNSEIEDNATLKVDISSENKAPRKKIRSTEDFNHCIPLSEDTSKSVKVTANKTKKTKTDYNLPRISHVIKDSSAKSSSVSYRNLDLEQHKKKNREKKISTNTDESESTADEIDYGTLKLRKRNGKQNKASSKNSKTHNEESDNYQSANSSLSDSEEDSEVEIVKRDKKKRSGSNNLLDNKTVEGYTERIKMLLNNLPPSSRKRKSPLSTLLSSKTVTPPKGLVQIERKSHDSNLTLQLRQSTSSTSNLKSVNTTQHLETQLGNSIVSNQGELSKNYLKKKSRSVSFIPHPKKKLNSPVMVLSSEENEFIQVGSPVKSKVGGKSKTAKNLLSKRQSKSIDSTPPNKKQLHDSFELSNEREKPRRSSKVNSTPYPKLINRQGHESKYQSNTPCVARTKIKRDRFHLSETDPEPLKLDGDLDDDVFDSTLVKKCDNENTNITRLSKKSVHFLSPEHSIRRETLILSKPRLIETPAKLLPDERDGNVDESIGGSSTFDKSPEIINRTNLSLNLTNGHSLFNEKITCQNFGMNTKDDFINYINKGNSKVTINRNSTDCTTPAKNINRSNIPLSSIENSCKSPDVSGKFNRQSTFTLDDDSVETENKLSNSTWFDNDKMPKLNRTATFTKDEQVSGIPPHLKYDSPLQYHNLCSKTIDTSKVNKRKRWNKSRLSASFLEHSTDILNTTAPWEQTNLNVFDMSNARESITKNDFENRKTSSNTSTPLQRFKQNLLKKTLSKGKSSQSMSKSKQNEQSVSKSSRTKKVPNFALIHQRALDKLENLQEMTERKAVRAKLLLSGHKPPIETMIKSSSTTKQLKFSPASDKKSLNEYKSLNNSNISVTKTRKISPSKSNPKVTNKENKFTPLEKKKELVKAKSHIPRPKLPNPVVAEKKGFTRFGFKVGAAGQQTTKEDQIKAVSTKSKVLKNTVQERRHIIQGVRSNRRFELLMSMRNK